MTDGRGDSTQCKYMLLLDGKVEITELSIYFKHIGRLFVLVFRDKYVIHVP